MVFLVDHQTESFRAIQHRTAGTLTLGQFSADQLAFHQQLPIQQIQLLQVHIDHLGRVGMTEDCLFEGLLDALAVDLGRPASKRIRSQIPSQSNPCTDDNIGLWPGTFEPFPAAAAKLL
jgi:hypothetical protein